MGRWIFSVAAPILLHMVFSNLSVVLLGQEPDPTLSAAIAAVLTIPAALWMYHRDLRSTGVLFRIPLFRGVFSGRTHRNPEDSMHEIVTNKDLLRTTQRAAGREESSNCAERFEKRTEKLKFGMVCFGGGGVLNMIWSSILTHFQIYQFFSNETQEALLASEILLQLIGLVVVVPAAEELIFRGLVYNRMKQKLSVGAAVFFSALLFSVYHGNPIQMIFAFPMALMLAAAYEYGRWLGFPILFHMGANLAAVLANM